MELKNQLLDRISDYNAHRRWLSLDGRSFSDCFVDSEKLKRSLYFKGDVERDSLPFKEEIRSYVLANQGYMAKVLFAEKVEEAFEKPTDQRLNVLGDTVDVFASHMDKNGFLDFANIEVEGYPLSGHFIDVMSLAMACSTYYGSEQETRKIVGLCGLLHDWGKSQVNSEILNYSGKLSQDQMGEMQMHTERGYEILRKHFSSPIPEVALEHHERRDGSGYPFGKQNPDDITEMISIADVYQALTSRERPYRSSVGSLDALSIIQDEMRDRKFSEKCFESFAKMLSYD